MSGFDVLLCDEEISLIHYICGVASSCLREEERERMFKLLDRLVAFQNKVRK